MASNKRHKPDIEGIDLVATTQSSETSQNEEYWLTVQQQAWKKYRQATQKTNYFRSLKILQTDLGLPPLAMNWLQTKSNLCYIKDSEPKDEFRQYYMKLYLDSIHSIEIDCCNETSHLPERMGPWSLKSKRRFNEHVDFPYGTNSGVDIAEILARTDILLNTKFGKEAKARTNDPQEDADDDAEIELFRKVASLLQRRSLSDDNWTTLLTIYELPPEFIVIVRAINAQGREIYNGAYPAHFSCHCTSHYSSGKWQFDCLQAVQADEIEA